jgi:hypothetical protein
MACEAGTSRGHGLSRVEIAFERRLLLSAGVRSLLLLSILFATLLLPTAAAWSGRPRAALRALLVAMFASEVAYALYLYAGFGRLLP